MKTKTDKSNITYTGAIPQGGPSNAVLDSTGISVETPQKPISASNHPAPSTLRNIEDYKAEGETSLIRFLEAIGQNPEDIPIHIRKIPAKGLDKESKETWDELGLPSYKNKKGIDRLSTTQGEFVIDEDGPQFRQHWGKTGKKNRHLLPLKETYGSGTYLIPNCVIDGRGTDDDVWGAGSIFFECDDISIDEQWKIIRKWEEILSVKATVVQTQKSLHSYFPLSQILRRKEGGIDRWVALQQRLIQAIPEADSSIWNPARLMRLPGHNHYKWDAKAQKMLVTPVILVQEGEGMVDPDLLDDVLPEWDEGRWGKTKKKSSGSKTHKHSGQSADEWPKVDNPWDMRNLAQYLVDADPGGRGGWGTAQCPVHPALQPDKVHSSDHIHINLETGAYKAHCGCDTKAVKRATIQRAKAAGHIFVRDGFTRWHYILETIQLSAITLQLHVPGLENFTFNYKLEKGEKGTKELGEALEKAKNGGNKEEIKLAEDALKAAANKEDNYYRDVIRHVLRMVAEAQRQWVKAEANETLVGYVEPRDFSSYEREILALSADVSLGKTANGISHSVFETFRAGKVSLIITSLRSLNANTASQYIPQTAEQILAGERPSEFQRLLAAHPGMTPPVVEVLGQNLGNAPSDNDLSAVDIVICCPESVPIANEKQWKDSLYHFVAIDESDASVKRLIEGTLSKQATRDKAALKSILSKAQNITIAQQNLTAHTVSLTEKYSGIEQTTVIENKLPPCPQVSWFRTTKRDSMTKDIFARIEAKEPVYIAGASKEDNRKLLKLLQMKFPHLAGRFYCFDAWFDREFNHDGLIEFRVDPNGWIREHRPLIVLGSPTLGAGFNISIPWFKHVRYLPALHTTSEDVIQAIARIRDALGERGQVLETVGVLLNNRPFFVPAKELDLNWIKKELEQKYVGETEQDWVNRYADTSVQAMLGRETADEIVDDLATYIQIERSQQWLEPYLVELAIEDIGWTKIDPPQYVYSTEGKKAFTQLKFAALNEYRFEMSERLATAETKNLEGSEPKNIEDVWGQMKHDKLSRLRIKTDEFDDDAIEGNPDLVDDATFWLSFQFGSDWRGEWNGVTADFARGVYESPAEWKEMLELRALRDSAKNYERKLFQQGEKGGAFLESSSLEISPIPKIQIDRLEFLNACPAWKELLESKLYDADSEEAARILEYCTEKDLDTKRLFSLTAYKGACEMKFIGGLLRKMGYRQICIGRPGGDGARPRQYVIASIEEALDTSIAAAKGKVNAAKTEADEELAQAKLEALEDRKRIHRQTREAMLATAQARARILREQLHALSFYQQLLPSPPE